MSGLSPEYLKLADLEQKAGYVLAGSNLGPHARNLIVLLQRELVLVGEESRDRLATIDLQGQKIAAQQRELDEHEAVTPALAAMSSRLDVIEDSWRRSKPTPPDPATEAPRPAFMSGPIADDPWLNYGDLSNDDMIRLSALWRYALALEAWAAAMADGVGK